MARTNVDIRDNVKREALRMVEEVRKELGVEDFTLSELVSDALQHYMSGGVPGYEPRKRQPRGERRSR